MSRYRVRRAPAGWPEKLPFKLSWPGHDQNYAVGDEFDRDFTPDEERDNLASGLLEIVPREYRVTAPDSVVFDTPTGGTFKAAFAIETEAALLDSHIERVEPAKKQTPKTPTKEATT